jgi:hypothetical protein
MGESFLTELQIKVLEMRARHMTLEEIASVLGTTKSNVSILEKRARKNIEKSYKTIQIWEQISAVMSIDIPAGTDVFDIPRMVYERGDMKKVKIPLTSVEIVSMVLNELEGAIRNRVLTRSIRMYITRNGRMKLSIR